MLFVMQVLTSSQNPVGVFIDCRKSGLAYFSTLSAQEAFDLMQSYISVPDDNDEQLQKFGPIKCRNQNNLKF